MGEWKAQMSCRIPEQLKKELYEFAEQEMRHPSAIGAVILEVGFKLMKKAGGLAQFKRLYDKPVSPGAGR